MEYNEQIQNVLEVVEEIKSDAPADTITLTTGVVLKRKAFPRTRIMALLDQFPYPEVPLVENKEKGRWERWEGSEQYQREKSEVDMKRGMAMIDIILVSGTEVVSIPDTFPKPEDDEWIEELELSHITVKRDSKIARKFAWLKYVAAVDEEDLMAITAFANDQIGEAEANVANQLRNNFQDN